MTRMTDSTTVASDDRQSEAVSRSRVPSSEEGRSGKDVDIDLLLSELPPRLVTTLAVLHEAPPGVAEITIQILPLGSRIALVSYGLAVERGISGKSGLGELQLTPLAVEAMAAADLSSRRPDLKGTTLDDLEARVEKLVKS